MERSELMAAAVAGGFLFPNFAIDLGSAVFCMVFHGGKDLQ